MARVSSAAIIGRDRDLEELQAAFSNAAEGRPRIVVVGGEAGIGKTRLLAELSARVTADGGLVLSGGCIELAEGSLPLLPLAEALRGLSRSVSRPVLDAILGQAREELARLVPEFADAGGAPASGGSLAPQRLYELVLGLLGRAGDHAPTVLALEDVHWIDDASRDLCSFLLRNLTSERLLLMLTYRSDDLRSGSATSGWLAELARGLRVSRLELERLGPADVRRQLEEILGGLSGAEVAERIWRRSDGNPYFVEELAAATATTGEGPSPRTLNEFLTARLALLSEPTRAVVRTMAVGGRAIDETLLAEVSARPVEQLRASLREAMDQRLIEPDPVRPDRLGFRHALVAEVAAAELLPGERRELHERFAMALAAHPELGDSSPASAAAELAHHWTTAGRRAEAYEAAIRAGELAAGVAAFAQAEGQFIAALELADELPDPPTDADRIALLRQAADAADLAGHLPRALALITTALSLADAHADPVTAGLLHSRLGYLHWAVGDGEAAMAEHQRAVELVPSEPPSAARARVLGALGAALMGAGRYEESCDVCRAAIDFALESGATAEEARARSMLGSDLVALGHREAGLEELERSRDMAAASGPPEMLVVAHHNLALNLFGAGRLDRALDEADAGREVARRVGLERRFGPDLAALAADVLLRLGRSDDAQATLAEAFALDPTRRGTIYLATVQGRLDTLRGDASGAADRFAVADELAAGQMDADLAAYLSRARAELALLERRPDEALTAVQAGLAHLVASHDVLVRPALLVLGMRAAAELAEDARARRDADGLSHPREVGAQLRAELEHRVAAGGAHAAALKALADAEWGRLEGRTEPVAWASAAAELAQVHEPELTAYANYRQAEAELRAQGVRGEARRALVGAHQVANQVGAEALLGAIRTLGRRARIDFETTVGAARGREPPQAAEVPTPMPIALSARELEVLRLVAEGRSNGQIAEELFITRKTAGVHVSHILDKLGVSNRVEAAMAAARLGLVADDER